MFGTIKITMIGINEHRTYLVAQNNTGLDVGNAILPLKVAIAISKE